MFAKEELALCVPSQVALSALLRVSESLGDAALLLRRLETAEAEYAEALRLAGSEAVVVARLQRKLASASQRDHDLAAAGSARRFRRWGNRTSKGGRCSSSG